MPSHWENGRARSVTTNGSVLGDAWLAGCCGGDAAEGDTAEGSIDLRHCERLPSSDMRT